VPRALEFICTVSEDAKLPKKYIGWIRDHLKLFAGEEVAFKIGKPVRSLRANSFYHAAIIEPVRLAMLEAGLGAIFMPDGSTKPISHDAVHAYFRDKYLAPTTAVVFGNDVTVRATTTKLDSTEFHWFIEQIKMDEDVRELAVYFDDVPSDLQSYSISD